MLKKVIAAVLVIVIAVSFFVIVQLTNREPNPQSTVSIPTDFWTNKTPPPTGGTSDAAVVNGKIYVLGTTANYEYDPVNDSWQTKTPMPTPRYGCGVAACEDRIFVIGGIIEGTGIGKSIVPATNINEVYDPTTDSWETKVAMPTNRSSMRAVTLDGKIYVIAGNPNEFSTVNTTEVYDPTSDSWTTKTDVPYGVAYYGSAAVDGKIYVIGGQVEFPHEHRNPGFVQIYDAATDAWSQGTPHPMPAWAGENAVATTGVYAPKRIYVFGGYESFAQGLSQNFVYDPATDSWSTAASMPNRRSGIGVAVVDDLIFVIGGSDGWNAQNLNQQYTSLGYRGTIPEPAMRLYVPDNYTEIEVAMDNLAVGGTIYVKNGNYTLQTLNIIKPLNLIGENPENTIINTSESDFSTLIKIASNNVRISNFTFNCRSSWCSGIVGRSNNTVITQNIFRDFSHAVDITGANNTITDNMEKKTLYGDD
jgi:N-acetylneuraminic acid mutarotase